MKLWLLSKGLTNQSINNLNLQADRIRRLTEISGHERIGKVGRVDNRQDAWDLSISELFHLHNKFQIMDEGKIMDELIEGEESW